MDNTNVQAIINNEYDYSNCLPTVECVTYLINYMSGVYENFIKMQTEDETKNEKFKYEYKEWKYKKSFGERFEISIRGKNYNSITCKDFVSFQSAVENGNLKNVSGLKITMDIDFKRGVGENLSEHENSFYISLEPSDIKFTRKSNYNDPEINNIENNIKTILEKFPTLNTIFCTK